MLKNEIYSYDRKKITAGILHFGVGNFHRAHQAYYTNALLSDADQRDWGICGAMILDKDERLFHSLRKQDGRYGLTIYGRNGEDETIWIGSIVELLWGCETAESIIQKVADPRIRIITLTITEGGYNLAKVSTSSIREFDFQNEDICYDLDLPSHPRTVFGYIASGLLERMESGAGPLSILSCDNLPHNGDVCKHSFLSFFERADARLFEWAKTNISFPNCMVDRITPATLSEDISRLRELRGCDDAAPVYCEDFIQWVIEDRFLAGRPAWERVGVEFAEDVTKHESIKLAFVNSTHLMLSFPAFLAGYRKVDEAVGDERIDTYLKQYMALDVTPHIVPPTNTDLIRYQSIFMERLRNKAVSDQLARLCFDVANKIPVYCIPVFTAMFRDNADMKRIAFFVAAYRAYLRRDADERGISYTVNDPGLLENDLALINSDDPFDFLRLSCFAGFVLDSSKNFVEWYLKHYKSIDSGNILSVMGELLE